MEPVEAVKAVCQAAAAGDFRLLQQLLAADPGLATATDSMGCTALWWAADKGKEGAISLLLEAAPSAVLITDAYGSLPLHEAAGAGSAGAVCLLLEAAPEAAMAANTNGSLPLHIAARYGSAGAVRLLLEAEPAAAMTADALGELPLHVAAWRGWAEAVRLLLEAAPAGALTADALGELPLHAAAGHGWAEVVRLLLEVAPTAATKVNNYGQTSLTKAILALTAAWLNGPARFLEAARLLLPTTPLDRALPALMVASWCNREVALPLFVDLAARTALSPEQWKYVPAACPRLGAALPAVLARSAVEAALLVGRMSSEERQRLRTGALCLGRAQRVLGVELPVVLVSEVLALAAGP